MLQQQGPAASFVLDGCQSGLLLSPLPKLPTGGYAFCAWVRVDGFVRSAAAASTAVPTSEADRPYEPRLFSLHDEHGRGIELHFVSAPPPAARHRTPTTSAKPDVDGTATLRPHRAATRHRLLFFVRPL